jgi:acyl carrier protein
MEKTTAIAEFVTQLLRNKGDDGPLTHADSLVVSGRIDSMDVLEIVSFMETKFGTTISAAEFDQYKFDTIESIRKLV